jgi:large subunit ribosomal protein L25
LKSHRRHVGTNRGEEVSNVSIAGEPRADFGKGAARKLRRSGMIPAVIYGHGQEVEHVALPAHELMLALRKVGLILEVTVDGKKTLVAPRDVQRDPVKRVIEHVDLVVVSKAEAEAVTAAAEEAVAAQEAEATAISEGADAAADAADDAADDAAAADAAEAAGDEAPAEEAAE